MLLVGDPVARSAALPEDSFIIETCLNDGTKKTYLKQDMINKIELVGSLTKAGINMKYEILTGRKSPKELIKAGFRLRKKAKREKVQLVHAVWGLSNSLMAVIFSPVPVIVTLCGSDLLGSVNDNGRKPGKYISNIISQVSCLFARKITVKSQQMFDILWPINKNKCIISPDGVNLDIFYPMEKGIARQRLSWDSKKPIILFFPGKNALEKDPGLAEAAVFYVQERVPEATMVKVKDIPHEFLNYYYNAADAFLLTSIHEGSNNSLKEALSCNLPVVSVNCGDAKERLQGVTECYLVNDRSPESLGECLIKILKSGRRSNGRGYVQQVSLENIAHQVKKLYESALNFNKGREYQICKRCIMDTTEEEIIFDSGGICNHCVGALARFKEQLLPPEDRQKALELLVGKIKKEGKGKRYDCIIGVSGGCDSTTTAYLVKKLGLRPLAVHFDNGWDSELAVENIKKTLEKSKIDLYTHVVDWEEFRDLQLSFLKASVADCEVPTDHGISALLFKTAAREGVKFILSGGNLTTEAIMPSSWSYYNQDLLFLKALHRKFGTVPLRTFPTISIPQYLYYVFVLGIRQVPFLNYIDYRKEQAKELLQKELSWRDYGGKHCESVWTRFFQGYYLPVKFGFDKRRAHLSTLICSGQITREAALLEMENPIYDSNLLKEDMQFVIKKLGLSEAGFQAIIAVPPRRIQEFPNHYFLFHKLGKYKNIFRKIATTP